MDVSVCQWYFLNIIIIYSDHSRYHNINLHCNLQVFFEYVKYIIWNLLQWRIQGVLPAPPPRVQILLFWHTNFSKRSHLGSWRPPTMSVPPLWEILDPLLYCRTKYYVWEKFAHLCDFWQKYCCTPKYFISNIHLTMVNLPHD